MATTTLTVPPKKNGAQPGDCGCATEGTCCGLECLVQPRFFCGQLLTDQDLTALVNWTRDKTALARYRHGWGVVCGLDVRCDPRACDRIVVTPGYAVSCCGDDIVVCEEASLDLSPVCRDEEDPCADLRRAVGERYGAWQPRYAGPHEADVRVYGRPNRPEIEDRKVVDIYIRYAEKLSEPATAFGRSACREVAACEYSRARESYELRWEYGMGDVDPVRARAERWHAGYDKCLKVLVEFNKRFGGGAAGYNGAETRRFLLDWLERNPLHYACDRRDQICALSEQDLARGDVMANLLFFMALDCRRAYLNCSCFGCEEDKGVPLARVLVVKEAGGGAGSCYVYSIDPYPPYRRPLQPECWPAPHGYVNVGRAIWHRWEEASTMLADLGVRVRPKMINVPRTPAEAERLLKCDLLVKHGEERVAYIIDGGRLEHRVIGFCHEGEGRTPALWGMITSDPATEAAENDDVAYTFEFITAGDLPSVNAEVTYHSEGVPDRTYTIGRGGVIPGVTYALTDTHRAPHTDVQTTLKLTGWTEDGAALLAEARHTLRVRGSAPAPLCPTFTVDSTTEVRAGQPATFTVHVHGGDPTVTPTFNWTVSAGTITSGQGTRSITVDTTGLASQTLMTTANVGGYDPSCQSEVKIRTAIHAETRLARKLDAQGNWRTHLDNLAIELQNDPTAQGYIICYPGRDSHPGEGQTRANGAKDYLVETRGIDASRLVAQSGGQREEVTTELWLVPQGATPPLTPAAPTHNMPQPTREAQPPPAPTPAAEDDFTLIPRIGPQTAQRVREAGIRTFAELAETPPERLREITKEIPGVGEEQIKEWIEDAKRRAR